MWQGQVAGKSAPRSENLAEDAEAATLRGNGQVCFLPSVAMCFGVTEQTWTCSCSFLGASATEPSRDFNGVPRTSVLYMDGKGDSTKRSSDCVGLGFRPSHCKQRSSEA